jgi:peptide/nickel transport system substrate-binding protein
MKRRDVIASAPFIAAPFVSLAQTRTTLRFVPRTALTALDPVFTTEFPTRVAGLAVYESLFATDRNLIPKHQMAAGHVVEQDGKRWVITLRLGLQFHDGEPVLARDCVASIGRWLKRDLLSRSLSARLDAVEAPDDHTVVFRLKRPFPGLAFALGKPLSNMLPIMPARLAEFDAMKPLTEVIGSGPFRFLKDEFSAGQFAAFAPFDKYHPREEPADGTAGGRRVMIDRLEWPAIPDPATATNALMTGEVDWVETPLFDLLPKLRAHRDITVGQINQYGSIALGLMNHRQGPTANIAIRQAILAAINPIEVMQAVAGDAHDLYTAPIGAFVPGSPYANNRGFERLGGHKSVAEIQAMLRAAGYGGERLVALHVMDSQADNAEMQVIVARLREVGMNVDDVAIDLSTAARRRISKEPLDKGGWSLVVVNPDGAAHLDPLIALALRTGPNAIPGWPTNPRMEELRDAWVESTDETEKLRLAGEIQEEGLKEVVLMPLGRFFQPTAWRKTVSGVVPNVVPVFWNLRKA